MDFFFRYSIFLEFFDQSPDTLLGLPHSIRSHLFCSASGDVSAGTMPQFEEPFMLQFGVRLHDGVRTHHQLLCQRAHTWKTIAHLKNSRLDHVANLLHQLNVDRLAAGSMDSEDHWRCTVSLIHNSCNGSDCSRQCRVMRKETSIAPPGQEGQMRRSRSGVVVQDLEFLRPSGHPSYPGGVIIIRSSTQRSASSWWRCRRRRNSCRNRYWF